MDHQTITDMEIAQNRESAASSVSHPPVTEAIQWQEVQNLKVALEDSKKRSSGNYYASATAHDESRLILGDIHHHHHVTVCCETSARENSSVDDVSLRTRLENMLIRLNVICAYPTSMSQPGMVKLCLDEVVSMLGYMAVCRNTRNVGIIFSDESLLYQAVSMFTLVDKLLLRNDSSSRTMLATTNVLHHSRSSCNHLQASINHDDDSGDIVVWRGRKRRTSSQRPSEPATITLRSGNQQNLIASSSQAISLHTDAGRIDVLYNKKTLLPNHTQRKARSDDFEVTSISVVLTPNFNKWCMRQFHLKSEHHRRMGAINILPATIQFKCMRSETDRIFEIAEVGTVQELTQLVEAREAALTDCDEVGRSLLSYAMRRANLEVVRLLIDNGADVDAIEPDSCSDDRLSPISMQCSGFAGCFSAWDVERVGCYAMLLQRGLDPYLTVTDCNQRNLVSQLMHIGTQEDVRQFLDHCYPPLLSMKILGRHEPLAYLISRSYDEGGHQREIPDKIALCLARGADPNTRDENGNTLLQQLLDQKLKPGDSYENPYRNPYQNPMRHDFNGELLDMLMLLITAGADVCARTGRKQHMNDVALKQEHAIVWQEALRRCGYVVDVVAAHQCTKNCSHPESKPADIMAGGPSLSFEEYLEDRNKRLWIDKIERWTREHGSQDLVDASIHKRRYWLDVPGVGRVFRNDWEDLARQEEDSDMEGSSDCEDDSKVEENLDFPENCEILDRDDLKARQRY